MKRTHGHLRLFVAVAALLISGGSAKAQDNVRGGREPIVDSIDPAKLTYDILVDGTLAQDDPGNRKFKTLQAAYAAAPEGTEGKPTVIGIMPNVYRLPGGAPRTPSMKITKNYITFLGLTNNRRSVVLADNRGLMQGAEDNGYILVVDAVGFTAKNLTIINYCNTDYEYPGDPGKNLTRRSDVITQAVALQASGDRHVYENVALLSRLDTMFLLAARSYFKNVYIEGTDDWMGGGQISVWDHCTLVFPTGRGVMSAANVVFRNCRFEAAAGMQFYKAEYGGAGMPVALINCILRPRRRLPGSGARRSRGRACFRLPTTIGTPKANRRSFTIRMSANLRSPIQGSCPTRRPGHSIRGTSCGRRRTEQQTIGTRPEYAGNMSLQAKVTSCTG